MCPAHAHGLPLLHLSGGRATLTLKRPDQHNRLRVEDLLALQRLNPQLPPPIRTL